MGPRMLIEEVERCLHAIYVATDEAELRKEDRRKAVQIAAFLEEVRRAAAKCSRRHPVVLVDAAAGKSYLGLLAAKLVFEPAGRAGGVVTIEREEARVEASRRALQRLGTTVAVTCVRGDVADASVWPAHPSIVAALHACGEAADEIIDRTIESGAKTLLLVPCCTSRAVGAAARAEEEARRIGIPRHAPVRRRFIQAMVDAERTWRLEAAGYETEVVEFVGAMVTPHNLLWRSRLVKEPVRMAAARAKLKQTARD